MSRSWTPREMYYADKMMQEGMGESLRGKTFVYVAPNGDRTPMESEQDLKIRKQFIELGFLFDPLPKLYNELSNHPKYRNKVLNQIEQHLEELIKHNNGSKEDVVWLWYIGLLDKNFYYNTYNNELFYEYIINEVNKLIK